MATRVKTGGRVKGTPNKLTKELRTVLKDLMHQELENLPDLLNRLEPKDRLEILVKLLPYAVPKIVPINYTADEPSNIGWFLDSV